MYVCSWWMFLQSVEEPIWQFFEILGADVFSSCFYIGGHNSVFAMDIVSLCIFILNYILYIYIVFIYYDIIFNLASSCVPSLSTGNECETTVPWSLDSKKTQPSIIKCMFPKMVVPQDIGFNTKHVPICLKKGNYPHLGNHHKTNIQRCTRRFTHRNSLSTAAGPRHWEGHSKDVHHRQSTTLVPRLMATGWIFILGFKWTIV